VQSRDAGQSAIEARELVKRFGAFAAVDGVSFEVPQGELFGLLGPNGAGKTTLTRMLTTLIVPTSGDASVAGLDVTRSPQRVREAIGVIPQALTSDLDLTGWENVDIYGAFYSVPRRIRHDRARHLLRMVGLSERANDLVRTYSGGMRRRLEIARGLIHLPQVLFLDEPTIGLDPQSRRAVWDLLDQLRTETGLTISLTTHYMDEAETLCDRIAIVDGGKIIALGTPTELKAMVKGSDRIELEIKGDDEAVIARLREQAGVHDVTREVAGTLIVSTDDGAHLMPRIVDQVESVGATVISIRLERMSLEDVFIRFTGRRLRDEPANKGGGFFSLGLSQPPPGRSL
jgi:ABC-2 type transport system ATP-binding protein